MVLSSPRTINGFCLPLTVLICLLCKYVRDISMGHLGNGPVLQPIEGRENNTCGNFVFWGSWMFHDTYRILHEICFICWYRNVYVS